MEIDLKEMARRGETERDFKAEFEPSQNLMMLPGGRFVEGALIEGTVEVYPDKAYVGGELTFRIAAECSRCLKPAYKTIVVKFDEEFCPAPSDREDVFVYDRDMIDLRPMADQLILTNMPYAIYCKDDCKGLCPTCGKDLNEGDCGCDKN